MYFYRLILIFILNLWYSESAKILSIFTMYSKSHNLYCQTIVKELASRGHAIVNLSYFKSDTNSTNYHDIQLEANNVESYVDSVDITDMKQFEGIWNFMTSSQQMEFKTCSKILQNNYIQDLIKSKSHTFDLIIAEAYFTKCYSLFAHKLNIPLVIVSATSTSVGIDNLIGDSFNPSYVPFWLGEYTTKMNFFQRLNNLWQYAFIYCYQVFIYDANLNQLSKLLDMDLPSDDVLNKRIALALYNNHFTIINKPLTPNVIDIAGIHIQDAKPLPKDILEFIESAEHGVIFFSFGTAIKASSIPPKTVQILLKVFSQIPQKVLWKVNEINVPLPPNIKTSKWFPQRDILEHENVILFISHCGLFGSLEAIYTATPVLAMPLFFDQLQNAKILEEKEVAIYLDFRTVSEATLLNSIQNLTDEKYRKNMRSLSEIIKDRPISPLNNAVYWIEYVVRHKDTGHLRTQGADMRLHQYLLLDVVLFVAVIFVLMLYSCKLLVCFGLSWLRCNKTKVKLT